MTGYGRGERLGLDHPFGDEISTYAEVHHHRRSNRATAKIVWIRTADPAVEPRRPDGVEDAIWQWLCSADHRWAVVDRKLGRESEALILAMVRNGCGELQTHLGLTVQWPPARWIPHPGLRAQTAAQRTQLAFDRDNSRGLAGQLAAAVDQDWPGLAAALRGSRQLRWLTWVAQDLLAGETFDGPRAFAQHHTGDTKACDTLVRDLLDASVEPQVLSALGINRNPYIGFGGPLTVHLGERRLDLAGWPGPLDIRLPADLELDVEISARVETLVVVENRQAAETVCDTHPDIAVIWCHGQPPAAVLRLIATIAAQVDRTLICPDADLGGVLIAGRIIGALPVAAEWSVVDVGGADHPEGRAFTEEARDRLTAWTARGDSLSALAEACLARGYAVEQEASTRAAILRAIAATAGPVSAEQP